MNVPQGLGGKARRAWFSAQREQQLAREMTYVELDKASVDKVVRQLNMDAKAAKTAIIRAVNKVAISARAEIVRGVRTKLNVRAVALSRHYVKVSKARGDKFRASIHIPDVHISLGAFFPKREGSGIVYRLQKGGKVYYRPGWFINISKKRAAKKGLIAVYERVGELDLSSRRRGRRYVRPRYPIEQKWGPSLYSAISNIAEFSTGVYERKLHERLTMELDRQVQVILDRKDVKRTA